MNNNANLSHVIRPMTHILTTCNLNFRCLLGQMPLPHMVFH